jgi:hypothetical protein
VPRAPIVVVVTVAPGFLQQLLALVQPPQQIGHQPHEQSAYRRANPNAGLRAGGQSRGLGTGAGAGVGVVG